MIERLVREELFVYCQSIVDIRIMMRALAAAAPRFSTRLSRSNFIRNTHFRQYSAVKPKEELSIEEEAERKIGWLLKLFFAGTATAVGYQLFPYMGDNLVQQSISLLRVKDPMFKRMGASRIARFAIDDERRLKIIELGGAEELVNMLGGAKDDRTRKEALKALVALSYSGEAVGALHHAGALLIIMSIPDSMEDGEAESYKSTLLKRFQELRYDVSY